MNVLSLFDGISCGRHALDRCNISITSYYASEVDKYAIRIAKKNYPDTIHVGDVSNIRITGKVKFDLLIGGSPCQGFSVAGKGLNFDDPRSKLFFEYVRILKALRKINPDIFFLLENVRMKKEWQDIISNELGVEPVKINSALVCAQNRVRLYWCNWKVEQPEDRGIVLKDILEDEVNEKYFLNESALRRLNNSSDQAKGFSKIDPIQAGTMTSRQYANWKGTFVKSPLKLNINGAVKQNQNKASTFTAEAHSGGNHSDMDLIAIEDEVRRLTPIECERLQGLPDNYTQGISDSQRYKCLGNGWQIDTIMHIFKQNS
jgi:DNA-cytosine methyltransferase